MTFHHMHDHFTPTALSLCLTLLLLLSVNSLNAGDTNSELSYSLEIKSRYRIKHLQERKKKNVRINTILCNTHG